MSLIQFRNLSFRILISQIFAKKMQDDDDKCSDVEASAIVPDDGTSYIFNGGIVAAGVEVSGTGQLCNFSNLIKICFCFFAKPTRSVE